MRYCYTFFLTLSLIQFASAQPLPAHSSSRIDTAFTIQAYDSVTREPLLCKHLCRLPTGDLLMLLANQDQTKNYFVRTDKFFQTQWAQLFQATSDTQCYFHSYYGG